MYCKKCGKKCNDNALYCQRCGAELYEKRTTKKGIAVVIIIGAICVAVVLILFAIGILGTGNSQTADMQDEAYQDKEGLHAEEQQNDDYDLYYKDKSTVITRWMVQESETTKTETETNDYLIGRGFTDYPITVEYSIDGKHNKAEAITIGSADKHPIYKTNYVSVAGDLWTIYVIDDSITAYPSTYNLQSNLDAQLIISENEEIVSYNSKTNEYYKIIPDPSVLHVRVVDHVDSETLDQLTVEALGS